jgi:Tol biopolymer transport system component
MLGLTRGRRVPLSTASRPGSLPGGTSILQPSYLETAITHSENLTMRSMTLTGAMLVAALLTSCAGEDAPSAPTTPEAAGPLQPKVAGLNGQIAFIQEEDVSIANPDGSNARQLVANSCCPHWSPDGSRIAVAASTDLGTITAATLNPDGSGYVRLPIDDPTLNVALGTWSPDGARLASEGWDDADATRNGIYTRRASDGGGLFRVTSNPFGGGHDIPGEYSPDGSRIVFVRTNDLRKSGNTAVFVVNTDGSGLLQITPWGMAGCCTSSWSPDGQWILLDVRGSLFVVHPDGTALRQIRLHPGSRYFAYEPGWSPDGRRIVFAMFLAANGQDDIFTAAADGTDLVQVTNTPEHEAGPDWGPRRN